MSVTKASYTLEKNKNPPPLALDVSAVVTLRVINVVANLESTQRKSNQLLLQTYMYCCISGCPYFFPLYYHGSCSQEFASCVLSYFLFLPSLTKLEESCL